MCGTGCNVYTDELYRPDAEIRAMFAAAGLDEGLLPLFLPVIVYMENPYS